MKHRLYISILTFTVALLIGTTFVRHHHHGSTVCTAIEYCEHDHETNDRHTSHHGDCSACAEKGEYLISRATDSTGTYHDTTTISPYTVIDETGTIIVDFTHASISGLPAIRAVVHGDVRSLTLRAPPYREC